MIKRQNYYFPDHDRDCHAVIIDQSADIYIVLHYVQDFSVCVQAGGNVGIWPFILSDFFDLIYTFEPDPENFACLQENLKSKKNVVMFEEGLSFDRESITVKSPDDAHLYNCGAYQVFPGTTPTRRIDDLHLNSCGLIYLDIEGYELKALQGAQDTIQTFLPVIVFEDKNLPLMYGKQVGDVEKWLETFGYKVAKRIHRDVICIPY